MPRMTKLRSSGKSVRTSFNLRAENATLPALQQAVQTIQAMILRGDGERLPSQRDLSQQLGLSRASLREAVSLLETLSLVRTEPARGVFVIDPATKGHVPRSRFAAQYSGEELYQLRTTTKFKIVDGS